MRLWSLHPMYLDKFGLVALWREALLAKKVLEGKTKGYRNHPQLIRFKNSNNPLHLINVYLKFIYDEAKNRNYNFDFKKIELEQNHNFQPINVTEGQLLYELQHLLNKLKVRCPENFEKLKNINKLQSNPVFKIVFGEIEPWEKFYV